MLSDGVEMVLCDVVCVVAEVDTELVVDIVVCSDAEGVVGAVMISEADI